MVNSIPPLNPLPPKLHSLVAHEGPTLQDLADNSPAYQVVNQAALLANVQDDLAALLASVMRRQASRRNELIEDSGRDSHTDIYDSRHNDAVEQVRSLIRSADTNWTVSYNLARSLFPDPSQLALFLASLLDDVQLDEELRAEIEQSLAALAAEYGQERLIAGANIRHVVSSFARRTQLNPDSLRQAYQSLLGGGSGEYVTYCYLIDVFGFSQRGLALDFLEQALAADMAANVPSHSPDDFQPLLALLFQCRLLRSADSLLTSTVGQHDHRNGNDSDRLNRALVELLLSALTDLRQAHQQFEQLLLQWRKTAPEQPITERAYRVLRAMADVPVELFPDLVYREALLIRLSGAVESLFYGAHASWSNLEKLRV